MAFPSSSNTWVMPSFVPRIPTDTGFSFLDITVRQVWLYLSVNPLYPTNFLIMTSQIAIS
jgi:hypothetical protein